MVILQASNINDKDKVVINMYDINITYINFQPKKIDEACLTKKIDKLFKIIELARRVSPHQLPSSYHFYPDKTIMITKKEVVELSNQLLMKKHISTKGNHEWRELVSRKYILIEDKKRSIYIMYPLEPMMFIMSGISFDKINKGETILVRGLQEWIDMKECIERY